MHRRAILTLATAIPLAGCTADLLGGDDVLLDDSFGDEQPRQFTADAGDDVRISIEVEELAEDDDLEGDAPDNRAVSVQISHDGTPVFAESVEDEGTYETTFEEGGTYNSTVTGGSAHVTVERV